MYGFCREVSIWPSRPLLTAFPVDPAHLGDMARVEALRQATLRHFNLLSLLCISAFVWLLFVMVMSAGRGGGVGSGVGRSFAEWARRADGGFYERLWDLCFSRSRGRAGSKLIL